MKKVISVSLMAVCMLFHSKIVRADDNLRFYGVESGIVSYSVTDTNKEAKKIYFDRWGLRETEEIYASRKDMESGGQPKLISISDGSEWIYSVDPKTRTAFKMPTNLRNPQKLKSLFGERALTEGNTYVTEKMGGKRIGSEVILDKPCEIWSIDNLNEKLWMWKGIILKTEVSLDENKTVTLATKIDTGNAVPTEKFALPAGIKVLGK